MTFERTSDRAIDTAHLDAEPNAAGRDGTRGTSPATILGSHLSRRRVLHGAAGLGVLGVASSALAACGTAAATGLAAVADVPVGGGVIVEGDEPVVVTQPTDGDFKCFTAICTHQGCTVGTVTDNVIACPCHGSMFSAETGEVVEGPAQKALAAVEIVVAGDQIMRA